MQTLKRAQAEMRTMDNSPVAPGGHDNSHYEDQVEQAPVRLLKTIPLFASGGTEGQVINLVRGLDNTRFDLQFACFKRWGHYLPELEARNIPVREFRISSLYKPGTLRQQLRLAAYMRREKIQVVHSYNFYANAFTIPAARLAGVPAIIASIRDRGVYLTPAQKLLQKWVCKLADRVLVNADAIRDWLVEDGYQADKIETIPNGIDLSRYGGGPRDSGIRRTFNLPADAPLVMMLSRLNPQKGVDDFIKAAAIVCRQHPDARFLLVGEKLHYKNGAFSQDEDYHGQLKRLTQSLGIEDRMIFVGHRSDIPDVLSEAAISVLPSHSEGLSNTILESMAAGVPVVASRVGGNPELVEDGVNGHLVPPRDPESLASAIAAILADGDAAARFGRASRERAERYYSLDRMVDKTQQIYMEELQRARGT